MLRVAVARAAKAEARPQAAVVTVEGLKQMLIALAISVSVTEAVAVVAALASARVWAAKEEAVTEVGVKEACPKQVVREVAAVRVAAARAAAAGAAAMRVAAVSSAVRELSGGEGAAACTCKLGMRTGALHESGGIAQSGAAQPPGRASTVARLTHMPVTGGSVRARRGGRSVRQGGRGRPLGRSEGRPGREDMSTGRVGAEATAEALDTCS